MLKDTYDTIIIGSGFGGSISAFRVAEAQRKAGRTVSVCVLERGKRYHRGEFPRSLQRPKDFWWRHHGSSGWRGLWDFRTFSNISVLQASGVGGTSLIYLDVQINAFDSTFEIRNADGQRRWPSAIGSVETLQPYYDRVYSMMRPSPIPSPTVKTLALEAGAPDRFKLLDLAIYWGQNGEERGVLRDDPYNRAKTHGYAGPPQTGCAYCGECFLGCNTHSKNTVDLHYLWLAQKMGAEVFSQHRTLRIEPCSGDPKQPDGYWIYYEDLRWGFSGRVRAKRVIVSAGSLGSSELLLRCKNGYRDGRETVKPTLPGLSDMLGHYFSGNGDFGAVAFETNRTVNPMDGPTITAALDYGDKLGGHGFLVEDGGFPDVLRANLERLPGGLASGYRLLGLFRRFSKRAMNRQLIETIFQQLDFDAVQDALPYLVMGIDAADGVMTTDKEGNLQIDWNNEKSLKLWREIESTLRVVSESRQPGLDGNLMMNPSWVAQKHLVTVHPLGGCPMGDDPSKGVVNADGEVFGYRNLFVLDGSIVPTALGPNPSKTIGALTERATERMIQKGIE